MQAEIEADFHIRQLYARFEDAAFRKDGKAYAALFTEDGEWKLGAMHIKGQSEIATTFAKLLGYTQKVQMITGKPLLKIDSNKAIARSQCTELTKMPDGSSSMAIGVYHDRFEKIGDQWLFRWRHFALHYRGPIDFSDELVPSPVYDEFPTLPNWDEPTLTKLKPEQRQK
ncbi:nuclear transport factor 2 family protein [Halioxenophilus aromaticivorans]|uniref:SnoaL-like domain-containing protein n=1 Tax=Halioxenophilus aromaticivorans TaxID=1306992 RepID=A0AAV3TXU5_9ALTE